MHLVLDDRSAQREAILLVDRRRLRAGRLFAGIHVAVTVVGVVVVHLAVEFIGTGLGHRGDRGARHLPVFGLVVGGDHLVLADRQFREGIALGRVLTGYATEQVALLAYAVYVDIHRGGVLRAAAQRGVAVLADREDHARHGVGELEEVARDLRHGLDLVLRDRLADL